MGHALGGYADEVYVSGVDKALRLATVGAYPINFDYNRVNWISLDGGLKFPQLASSSGENCMQIDNVGNVTNTGAACGSGGTGLPTTGGTMNGPIAFSPATVARDTAINLIGGSGGPTPIAGLVNDSSTDMATVINSILSPVSGKAGNYLLPSILQGNLGSIQLGSTVSANIGGINLAGTGWLKSTTAVTQINYTPTTGNGIQTDCHLSSLTFCTGFHLSNFNLSAVNGSSGIGVWFGGTSSGNSGTYGTLNDSYIVGFNQAIGSYGWASLSIGSADHPVWTVGSTATTGFLNDFSGSTNSSSFNIQGSCTIGVQPTCAGFFRIQGNKGLDEVHLPAVSYASNVFTLGVAGTSVANATVWVGDTEIITGPIGNIAFGNAEVYAGQFAGSIWNVGAPYLVNGTSSLAISSPPASQQPNGPTLSVTGSGSTFTTGTEYVWTQYLSSTPCNPVATGGPLCQTGASTVASIGVTAGQNIVVTFPTIQLGNAVTVQVFTNTSNSISSAQLAATVTLPSASVTLTAPGAGATPTAGNIPLVALESVNASVIFNAPPLFQTAAQNYGEMVQMPNGEYVMPIPGCVIATAKPTAGPYTRYRCYQIPDPSGTSAADALYFGMRSYSGSTPTDTWSNNLFAGLTIPGSNGDALVNSGGSLGSQATTGSGNVVRATAPTVDGLIGTGTTSLTDVNHQWGVYRLHEHAQPDAQRWPDRADDGDRDKLDADGRSIYSLYGRRGYI